MNNAIFSKEYNSFIHLEKQDESENDLFKLTMVNQSGEFSFIFLRQTDIEYIACQQEYKESFNLYNPTTGFKYDRLYVWVTRADNKITFSIGLHSKSDWFCDGTLFEGLLEALI